MFYLSKHFINILSFFCIVIIGCNQSNKTNSTVVPNAVNAEKNENITSISEEIKVTAVTLSNNIVTLSAGALLKLNALVTLTNSDKNTAVKWVSTNPEVAFVDGKGLVNALKKGKTIIKAVSLQNPAIFAECQVFVNELDKTEPSVIVISNLSENEELAPGDNIQLLATVKYQDGSYDNSVSWQSSDETIAVIGNDAILSVIKPGNITVTATAKKNTAVKAFVNINIIKQEALTEIENTKKFIDEFDLFRDFSTRRNPNGVWQYGTLHNNNFILHNLNGSLEKFHGTTSGSGLYTWKSRDGEIWTSHVIYNPTAFEVSLINGEANLSPKSVCLIPGLKDDDFSAVRWTAPENGKYLAEIKFNDIKTSVPSTTKVTIQKNNTPIYIRYINIFGSPAGGSFSEIISFNKNDTLDLMVSNHDDSSHDVIEVKMRLVKHD